MNLDKDLEEILSKIKQMGGSEEDKATRLWTQVEGMINKKVLKVLLKCALFAVPVCTRP